MSETRQTQDPISGEVVTINNDLVRRLRGEYACGPTLPSGEPEFGWRRFGEPSTIDLEAASEIEKLRAALGPCITALMFEAEQAHQRQDDVALLQIGDAVKRARAALETAPKRPCSAASKIDVRELVAKL